MILPDKYVLPEASLAAVGAIALKSLQRPMKPDQLWRRLKNTPAVGSYERFALALDFLFMHNLIAFQDGLISRS